MHYLLKDPFRYFFPLGIFCLLYGLLAWILFVFWGIGNSPIDLHAYLFLGGYLFFSIVGFLLTAIPRFSDTDFLKRGEFFTFFLISIVIIWSVLLEFYAYFWFGITLTFVNLMVFAIKRIKDRKKNPPPTFIFVGLGLLLGFIGSFFHFLSQFLPDDFSHLQVWGKLLFYDSMVSALILGIGSKLLPFIWGFDLFAPDKSTENNSIVPSLDILIVLIAYIIAILLEGNGIFYWSQIIKASCFTFVGFRFWKLHIKIPTKKWHGRMLKLSAWSLVIGSWSLCIENENIIHFRHVIYIGCYVLMTMMISSRVILSHVGHDLLFESRKNPYLIIGLLVLLSMSTRVFAFLIPDSYFQHLGYAAIVLIAAIFFWFFYFGKLIFRVIEYKAK